ncbi:hypothetical protein C3747_251g39 [Trypanosoma cruzi]|uniref:Uncharacterized protein n=1 Tax=Trypanosoma cruzi TaxID=5693 RepID=A0A2V2VK49_TRYCR|nr:hypothetical protein C3747_251g39 [Trypanosoma cruzi]
MENAWIIRKGRDIIFPTINMPFFFMLKRWAVLENGERIHILTTLQPGTLAQNVTFRTVFHVKNYLSYNISFRSMRQGSEVAMIRPGELSCIPLSCLDSTDVVTRLASIEDNNESRDELLWEESPRKLLEVALSRGEDSIGRLKEFFVCRIFGVC